MNTVPSLKILNYDNKFKKYLSIKVIKLRKKEEQIFTFNYNPYDEVLNKVMKLQTAKTIQQNDSPTNILEKNLEVLARYFHENINFCIENSIFLSDLKVAKAAPAFWKKLKVSKYNYRPISILPKSILSILYLKYMKYVFKSKFRVTLKKFYLNINVDFAKDLMHNTV